VQIDVALTHAEPGGDLVHVEHEGPIVDDHSLGQPGGPARVHQNGQVVLLGLGRHDGRTRRDQILVGDVVGYVARADQFTQATLVRPVK